MSFKVLILDDDADFNGLLTDIFEQADYEVTSLEDPIQAVDVFNDSEFDLVVTDHKMPEMTGAEFMKTIKGFKPEIPVVMVSGYLENDTIRDLIREGVGGVFLKPLNIFSLLERTAELVEESRKCKDTSSSVDSTESRAPFESPSALLGFNFRSFPCKSSASFAFAERLYSLRNFKLALTLIGPPGTHYRQICDDICNFYNDEAEHFVYLEPAIFDEANLCPLLDKAKENGANRVTCVLLEVEEMSLKQKQLATALPKAEGAFSDYGFDIRVVFCVSGDLDELYDTGVIDEHLYILMGTAEVRVPSLGDCASDVAVMAQQIVAEVVREKELSVMPRLDKPARDFLRKNSSEQNYMGLSRVMRAAVERCDGETLTVEMLEGKRAVGTEISLNSLFENLMIEARKDIVAGAAILLGDDTLGAASFFGVDSAKIDQILN